MLGLFNEHDFGAEFFEAAAVGVEIALQGEHSDFHTDLILPERTKFTIGASGKAELFFAAGDASIQFLP